MRISLTARGNRQGERVTDCKCRTRRVLVRSRSRLRGQATCVRLLASTCILLPTVAPPQPHPLPNLPDVPAARSTDYHRLTAASRKHWKDVHATFPPGSSSSVHSLSHRTFISSQDSVKLAPQYNPAQHGLLLCATARSTNVLDAACPSRSPTTATAPPD